MIWYSTRWKGLQNKKKKIEDYLNYSKIFPNYLTLSVVLLQNCIGNLPRLLYWNHRINGALDRWRTVPSCYGGLKTVGYRQLLTDRWRTAKQDCQDPYTLPSWNCGGKQVYLMIVSSSLLRDTFLFLEQDIVCFFKIYFHT